MRLLLRLFIISFLVFILIACQDQSTYPIKNSKENNNSFETIRVASWSQAITEQINLLVNDEKSFFTDEQLNIEFIPGNGGGDAIKHVLANNADVAFTDAGSFFSALDQGEDLVAIYNIYPQNIFNIVSLKENNITSPEQLVGKTVGVYSLASGTRQNLLIILHEIGLTESDIEIVETGLLNFAPLIQGQVDATAATDTGLFLAEKKGLDDVNVIEVKDYLNFSSDLFVVTREFLEENETLLRSFLRGYKQSIEWMIATPEEAAELAVKYAIDGQDVEINQEIIELRNEASQSEHELGYIDLVQLQEAANTYKQLDLIENELDLTTYITNELLPKE